MILYIVRHGESTSNRDTIISGQEDHPLTIKGKKEAELIAKIFHAKPLDRILTSEQPRARQTAEIIGMAHGVPVTIDSRFNAINAGTLANKKRDELTEIELQAWKDIGAAKDNTSYGGETVSDVIERAHNVIDEMKASIPDEAVCIVTHHMTKRALVKELLDLTREEMSQMKFGNTAMSEFQLTPDAIEVIDLNSIDHLGENTDTFDTLDKIL